jgi:hypothetical protein
MEQFIATKSTSKQRSHFNFPEITYYFFFNLGTGHSEGSIKSIRIHKRHIRSDMCIVHNDSLKLNNITVRAQYIV